MPYQKNSDLPEDVKERLPQHAQDIYREAYNSAYEQYDKPEERREGRDREETSHAVAWNAVKHKYEKVSEDKWARKDED